MTYIFWGYIFVFFHLKINGFDLLADVIGWALIAAGLSGLADKSEHFSKAKPWAIGLAIYTGIVSVGQLMGMNFDGAVFGIVGIIGLCINLYISNSIVCGVHDLEQTSALDLGAPKLAEIWKIMAALNVVGVILFRIPNEAILMIAAVVSIGALIANIVFLVRFYRAKKVYESI